MLYNKSYIELLGDIHPCMGVSARVAFQDFWDEGLEPLMTRNRLGEVVEKTDYHLRVHRNGFGEETYFSFKFMPVLDSDGATVGSYQTVMETVRAKAAGHLTFQGSRLGWVLPAETGISSYANQAPD